ncbi:leucine-rich repeat neuronal protein 2 [Bradysia coprophila]|uniref:leucine-rich repeat neuronal protein 2 n=1 Tax=Bradysia coprophila TaxID=38358 RepID=UPI00187D9206|nr:leucine-rich repeat neuronal protein 2 [Bradysia coprophila]
MNIFHLICLAVLLHRKFISCQDVIHQLCVPIKPIIPSEIVDAVDDEANNNNNVTPANRSTSDNLYCECVMENSSQGGLLVMHIHCENRKFKNENFAAEVLPTVTNSLDMSWNEFQFVPNFVGYDLSTLDMSHNAITVIDDNNFAKVKNLSELNLSWNKIEALSINAFARLGNLLKLDLSRNLLQKITNNVFSTLPSMTHLILSRNRFLNETFSVNDVDLYISLGVSTKLNILEIEDANLDTIDLLQGVGLKVAKFRCNQFELFPSIPRSIEILDLSENPLRTLEAKVIPHLNDLEEIYLNDMPRLSSIQEYAFFGLPKLRTVSLEGSWKLTFFSGEAFGDYDVLNGSVTSLEVLNLRGTSLKYIDETLVTALDKIKKFDLNGNPLICNCDVRWIKDIGLETNGRCYLPQDLRGELLTEISDSDLKCRRWSAWVYKTLNGLMILLLLILCGVATWLIVMGLRPSRRVHLQKVGAASPYARVTIEPNRADDLH